MSLGRIIERWQWMSSPGRGERGVRWEIRELNEAAFRKFFLPRLREGYADSLRAYQRKHPEHQAYVLKHGTRDTDALDSGRVDRIRPYGLQLIWAIPVDRFDDPIAREWGSIHDEKAYRYGLDRGSIVSAVFRRTPAGERAEAILRALHRI